MSRKNIFNEYFKTDEWRSLEDKLSGQDDTYDNASRAKLLYFSPDTDPDTDTDDIEYGGGVIEFSIEITNEILSILDSLDEQIGRLSQDDDDDDYDNEGTDRKHAA